VQNKDYKEIEALFDNNLKIGKIIVSNNRLLSDSFGIKNIPYFILLKYGKPIMQMHSFGNKEYLINESDLKKFYDVF